MWIKSHGNLARHPKTRRLMRRMGWSLPFTIGNLHLLWWWALEFAPSGDLSRFEPDQITADLDLGGATPAEFMEAMIYAGFIDRSESEASESRSGGTLAEAGFLDRIDGELRIHDWRDYSARSGREPRLPASSHRSNPLEHPPHPVLPPNRDSAVHRNALVDSSDDTTPSASRPGAVARNCEAPAAGIMAGRGPATPQKHAPLAIVDIPRVLDNLPSFTDLWWSQFLDIYNIHGAPLDAEEQRGLLARLAANPFSAIPKLKIAISDAKNGSARRMELFQNTS